MSQFYEELCNMFIRPTRQTYNLHDLGNPIVKNIGRRRDFQVISHHNLKLKCSYFETLNNKSESCVVYLHSFNGSRLQSLRYCGILLERGCNVCSFDFAGSGMSEGEYVSLGYHQCKDLLQVLKFIGKTYGIWNFQLWGRSMGAATIIKFCQYLGDSKNHEKTTSQLSRIKINSIVLDSPFCSLNRLALEIAKNRISVPQIFLRAVFLVIRTTIQKKADFKVSQLELLSSLHYINFPVFIIASHEDTLVRAKHAQDIYEGLKIREKEMIFIKGEHHQVRDNQTVNKVIAFLEKTRNRNQTIRGSLLRDAKQRNCDKLDRKLVVNSQSRNKYAEQANHPSKIRSKIESYVKGQFEDRAKDHRQENRNKNIYICQQQRTPVNLSQSTHFHQKKPSHFLYPTTKNLNSNANTQIKSPRGINLKIVSEKDIRMRESRISDEFKQQLSQEPKIIHTETTKMSPMVYDITESETQIKETHINFESLKRSIWIQNQHRSIPMKIDSLECKTTRLKQIHSTDQQHYNVINSKLKKKKKQNPHPFFSLNPSMANHCQTSIILSNQNLANDNFPHKFFNKNTNCQNKVHLEQDFRNMTHPIEMVIPPEQHKSHQKQIMLFKHVQSSRKVSLAISMNEIRKSSLHNENVERNQRLKQRRFQKPQQGNSSRKNTFRCHTVDYCENQLSKEVVKVLPKNTVGVISLKNLTNEIFTEYSSQRQVKHKNNNHLKKSQKCIILKSPKKRSHPSTHNPGS